MLKPKIKFTYSDYKSLPESETKRYELLEGELVMVPSPNVYHQTILERIFLALHHYLASGTLGEVHLAPLDVVLSQEDVVQPDILFISRERSRIITERNIQGAPDLIIEILSPATAERDRTYKRTLYARHGVQEYWIVDPENKFVEVMTLAEKGLETVQVYKAGELLNSPLLKELSLNLGEVFQKL